MAAYCHDERLHVREPAQHTMTVVALSTAASNANIDTVTSNGGTASDLVHGATYTVKVEYRDDHSNSAASVTHTGVEVGELHG